MWLLITRPPRPDANVWPGRRFVAALDALAWPLLAVWLIRRVDVPVGLVGPFTIAMAAVLGLERLHRAVCRNHRYWCTTWRFAKVVGGLLLIGFVMKIAML